MLQFGFDKVPLGYFENERDFWKCLRSRNLINGMWLCNDTLRWLKHSVVCPILKHSHDHLSKTLAEPIQ